MREINKERDLDGERIVPFQVFQAHCCERDFVYAGRPGYFHVGCHFGPVKCNMNVCPIWNSDRVKQIDHSLRGINLSLKNTLNRRRFHEQISGFHARSGKRN